MTDDNNNKARFSMLEWITMLAVFALWIWSIDAALTFILDLVSGVK